MNKRTYLVIAGNFSEGFIFYGPYETFEAACFDFDMDPDSWIATLEPPKVWDDNALS